MNARPSASRSIFENLGVGLQSQEVQLFVVMITVMDICGLVAELYFESKRPMGAQEVPRSISELERVLQYIPVLSLFIYTLELLLLLFAFGGKIFSHSGYTTDCAILLLMGYGRFSGSDKILRLLNLARVWRIVRMVNARISAIEDEYVQSMSILETEVDRLQSLEVDLKATKSALKKEKDKAIRMEETFRSQREQVGGLSFHQISCWPNAYYMACFEAGHVQRGVANRGQNRGQIARSKSGLGGTGHRSDF